MLVERKLDQDGELLVVEPSLVRRLHARPRPAAAALHLAALHREPDLVAARIAGDDFILVPSTPLSDLRELVGVGRAAGAADDQLLGQQVLELGDAAGVPGDADADFVVGAADPGELGGVELRGLVAEQRIEAGAAADDAERRAVLRADVVEPVGEPQAAGALHVLRHDRRDCRGCACPCGARACAHRGRRRRRRCSRCRGRRSCPCRTRRRLRVRDEISERATAATSERAVGWAKAPKAPCPRRNSNAANRVPHHATYATLLTAFRVGTRRRAPLCPLLRHLDQNPGACSI